VKCGLEQLIVINGAFAAKFLERKDTMSYRLFIDDERAPLDVKWGTVGERRLYREEEWFIARNWTEVLELIVSLGMPHTISFDHDLGDNQPTGYDIAKRIADLIMNAQYELDPEFLVLVHSKNPVGAENIRQYMKNFLSAYKNE
jgi:hypothetical protein